MFINNNIGEYLSITDDEYNDDDNLSFDEQLSDNTSESESTEGQNVFTKTEIKDYEKIIRLRNIIVQQPPSDDKCDHISESVSSKITHSLERKYKHSSNKTPPIP